MNVPSKPIYVPLSEILLDRHFQSEPFLASLSRSQQTPILKIIHSTTHFTTPATKKDSIHQNGFKNRSSSS